MTPSASRSLSVVLSLIVGFFFGWLVFRGIPTPPPQPPAPTPTVVPLATPTPIPTPSNHLIVVGPDPATLSEKDPAVIAPGYRIHWISDNKQSLTIIFPRSGFPSGITIPPFEDMKKTTNQTTNAEEWVFQHPLSTSVTDSGSIKAALPASGTYKYKYDQVLADRRADGWIIIKK